MARSRLTTLIALALLAGGSVLGQSEMVIYKEGTAFFHRAGCAVVRDLSGVLAMTRAQAEARGHKPHPDCDPSNPNAPAQKAPPPAPITVYLDGSKYYHRKECSKLADVKAPKAVLLEEAGKVQWPCPVCKAPRRQKSTEKVVLGPQGRGR